MVSNVTDNLIRKLDRLDDQYEQLGRELLAGETLAEHRRVRELSIKRAALEPLVSAYRAYRKTAQEAQEWQAVLTDGSDPELAQLAREELPGLTAKAQELLESVQRRLVTTHERTVVSLIL